MANPLLTDEAQAVHKNDRCVPGESQRNSVVFIQNEKAFFVRGQILRCNVATCGMGLGAGPCLWPPCFVLVVLISCIKDQYFCTEAGSFAASSPES